MRINTAKVEMLSNTGNRGCVSRIPGISLLEDCLLQCWEWKAMKEQIGFGN